MAAPKTSFREAYKSQGRVPRTITLNGYQASHRAVREPRAEGQRLKIVTVRSCQYFKNIVKQGHRGVKRRLRPMLGRTSDMRRSRLPASSCCMRFVGDNSLSVGCARPAKTAPEIKNAVLVA